MQLQIFFTTPQCGGRWLCSPFQRDAERQLQHRCAKAGDQGCCRIRGLPEPIFYEDDERIARGEQIAKRPAFKKLLDDIQADPGRSLSSCTP